MDIKLPYKFTLKEAKLRNNSFFNPFNIIFLGVVMILSYFLSSSVEIAIFSLCFFLIILIIFTKDPYSGKKYVTINTDGIIFSSGKTILFKDIHYIEVGYTYPSLVAIRYPFSYYKALLLQKKKNELFPFALPSDGYSQENFKILLEILSKNCPNSYINTLTIPALSTGNLNNLSIPIFKRGIYERLHRVLSEKTTY